MLPHMTDQYIEGAALRVQKHQRQDVLASKAALHKMIKAAKAAGRPLKKVFKRRSTLGTMPKAQRQHS